MTNIPRMKPTKQLTNFSPSEYKPASPMLSTSYQTRDLQRQPAASSRSQDTDFGIFRWCLFLDVPCRFHLIKTDNIRKVGRDFTFNQQIGFRHFAIPFVAVHNRDFRLFELIQKV